MTDFVAPSVDVVVPAIRAWAEAPWPVTRQQAAQLVRELGWSKNLDDPRFVDTNFGLRPQGGDIFYDGDVVAQVFLELTTIAPRSQAKAVAERSWRAFDTYVRELSADWGAPELVEGRRITSAQWTLQNGASAMVHGADQGIQFDLLSPQGVQATEMAEGDD